MIILGIETSCDETAASVVRNGREILSNVVSSQISLHRDFGGVVPEIASRCHAQNIELIVEEALKEAGIKKEEINLVAVTKGPGLVGSLLVGIMFSQGFSQGLKKPIVGINHLEAHIFGALIENPDSRFPFICLLVSGGHTILVVAKDTGRYEVLGQTIDDAAGEAFDKVANMLNLGYPGGPAIDKISLDVSPKDFIRFPRPMLKEKNFDFSFSGLKTAVLYHLKKIKKQDNVQISDCDKKIIAASFQEAVIDTLVKKTVLLIEKTGIKNCALGGGVAANEALRKRFKETAIKKGFNIFLPSKKFCTDNAVMIAGCAFFRAQKKLDKQVIVEVDPSLRLGSREN